MSTLVWGSFGQRFYEAGIDRGVLYLPGADGVPWSGLTAVNEAPSGGTPTPYYLDGVKYLNISSLEEYEATIEAFSAPPEFTVCDGTASISNGLFVTQQPRKQFGFSYRSKVGNDIEGIDHGYKIHIVYNALAAASDRQNKSLSNNVDPVALSWAISTVPPKFSGYRPTAHFIVDSRYTNSVTLGLLENILYGYSSGNARLPDVDELIALFGWNPPDVGVPLNFLGFIDSPIQTIVNLSTNPDLETGTTGWTPTGATQAISTAQKHSGNQSLAVTTAGAALAEGIVYGVTLTGMAGLPYASGIWVKAPVGAKLYTVTRTIGSPSGSQDTPQVSFTGTGDWQFVQTPAKIAQSDATSLQIQVRTNTTVQAITFYVDDAIIVQATSLDILPFNGSSQNVVVKHQRVYPAWQGAANASRSSLDYFTALDYVGQPGDAYILSGSLWVYLPAGYWQNYGGIPSI